MDTYYIDGKFVGEDEAHLSIKDITVLRGYGVFDFMITYNRLPFHLKEHVTRIENSAKEIGLRMNHTHSQICEAVLQTIERNPDHKESNIRIIYTGGVSPDGITPQGNGILMVMVTPKQELPVWWYTDGAPIATVNMERFIPTAKSTNYLSAVFAQQEARKTGGIEAVYVDKKNRVLEGTTSNFFGIRDGVLITPQDGILPGITRQVVLELVKNSYAVQLRHIDKTELPGLDEIFLSASNKEIVPVVKVDDIIIGDGHPGEITKDVMGLFKNFTDEYSQDFTF